MRQYGNKMKLKQYSIRKEAEEEKRNKELMGEIEKNNQDSNLNPTMSIIILNVNGLNNLIKRQRLSKWIKKQDPTIRVCYL